MKKRFSKWIAFLISTQKELSLCHQLWFFNTYIFAAQCRRPEIFQSMNYVRSNNLSLKYQRFTPSGCTDIGIRIFEFATKTQFLSDSLSHNIFFKRFNSNLMNTYSFQLKWINNNVMHIPSLFFIPFTGYFEAYIVLLIVLNFQNPI